MNIEEIKKDAIYSDSQSRLFELMIEMTEEMTLCHLAFAKAKDSMEKVEIKGKMALISTIQHILEKRIEEVQRNEREEERKELLTTRQFRIAAEMVLTKETFVCIRDLSLINYKKLKDQKNELKANKLE